MSKLEAGVDNVNPVLDITLGYLRTLWPDPPAGYLLLWRLVDERSLWFPASGLEAVAAAATEQATHTDVYLGCGLSPADNGPARRCKAPEVLAIPGLWADVDFVGPCHKKANLPPDSDNALSLAREMPLPPSLIVYSGHGIQPWWLFSRPWTFTGDDDRAAAGLLVRDWQALLRRRAEQRGWTLDSTHDLARVLRLPGTVNRKAEPVAVTMDLPAALRRYDPAVLREAMKAATSVSVPAAADKGAETMSAGDFFQQAVHDASRLPPLSDDRRPLADDEVFDRAKNAANGDKFLRLWDGDISDYPSQSEADLALCSILAYWKGGDRAGVERLFGQSKLGKRSKWSERADYRRMTLDKALNGTGTANDHTSPSTSGTGTASSHDNGNHANARKRQTGYEIILQWFREVYRPRFKRGTSIFSEEKGEIKMSMALAGAPHKLIARLAFASDAPRDQESRRAKRGALPKFFATWARSAWVDLVDALPDEEAATKDSEAGKEEFAAQIATVLHTIVPFGTHVNSTGHETKVERRSLINFCELWAKPQWGSIRSLNLWCRREKKGAPLEVALRKELFAQVVRSDLAKLSKTKLTRLCEHYRIGRGTTVLGRRVIVLTSDFLAEHVAGDRTDADSGRPVGNPECATEGAKRDARQGATPNETEAEGKHCQGPAPTAKKPTEQADTAC